MIARWSAYAEFLEAVVRRQVRHVDVEEECQVRSLWDAVLEAQ